jgi:hypothetical protein
MKKIINDLLTGKDNQTHDIGRWSLVFTMFAFLMSCIYNAVHAGIVDLEKLYLGVAAIVSAHGAALLMKKDSEPDAVTEDK